MNFKNFLLILSCFLYFGFSAFSQQPTTSKPSPDSQLPAEIKEKAVSLLRLTAKDANHLSLPENRLAFLIATADVLWEYDEAAARDTFQNAQNDVRQMILTQQQKQAAVQNEKDEVFDDFLTGDGSRMDIESIRNLRESVILSLAKHDGEAAYRFLNETRPQPAAVSNEIKAVSSNAQAGASEGDINYDYRENALELKLARVVAQNDPQKALEIGQKRLEVGVSGDLLGLTVRLYLKDKERGAKLAKDFFKKLKTSNLSIDNSARSVALSLLRNGANALKKSDKTPDFAKTPFLSEADLRELADTVARAALAMKDAEDYQFYDIRQNLSLLEKYAPSPTAQLKVKLNPPAKTGQMKTVTEETEISSYVARAVKEEDERKKTKEDLENLLQKTDDKTALEQARQTLSKIKNRTARLTALSQFAITLAERGQTDAAKELLNDARRMINPQPKFWAHYVENLMVARAYASVDPKQSLEMLESLVYHLDDTIGGLAKFGEFIAGETAVKENELRLSGIPGLIGGGGSIVSMVARGNGADFASGFEKDITKLAKADFERTAALTDKFSRGEIRLMARLLIINSLLPQEENAELFSPASIEIEDGMPDLTVTETTTITATKPQ